MSTQWQCLSGTITVTPETKSSYKGWISVPRWKNPENFIANLAWDLNLNLEKNVSKGLVYITVRYKVTGKNSCIEAFRNTIMNAVDHYLYDKN